MSDPQEIISSLEGKIEKLTGQNKQLLDKVRSQVKTIDELRKENRDLQQRITTLEENSKNNVIAENEANVKAETKTDSKAEIKAETKAKPNTKSKNAVKTQEVASPVTKNQDKRQSINMIKSPVKEEPVDFSDKKKTSTETDTVSPVNEKPSSGTDPIKPFMANAIALPMFASPQRDDLMKEIREKMQNRSQSVIAQQSPVANSPGTQQSSPFVGKKYNLPQPPPAFRKPSQENINDESPSISTLANPSFKTSSTSSLTSEQSNTQSNVQTATTPPQSSISTPTEKNTSKESSKETLSSKPPAVEPRNSNPSQEQNRPTLPTKPFIPPKPQFFTNQENSPKPPPPKPNISLLQEPTTPAISEASPLIEQSENSQIKSEEILNDKDEELSSSDNEDSYDNEVNDQDENSAENSARAAIFADIRKGTGLRSVVDPNAIPIPKKPTALNPVMAELLQKRGKK